jgi:hypothetical protein
MGLERPQLAGFKMARSPCSFWQRALDKSGDHRRAKEREPYGSLLLLRAR